MVWWNSIEGLTRVITGAQITIIVCSIFVLVAGARLTVLRSRETQELRSALAETKGKLVAGTGVLRLTLEWDVLHPAPVPGTNPSAVSNTWKSTEIGSRAYVVFLKSSNPVLLMRSTYVIYEANDGDSTIARVDFSLSTPESFATGSILDLSKCDTMQIYLPDIPPSVPVRGGSLSATLNGSLRLGISIPSTVAHDGLITVGLPDNMSAVPPL